MTDAESVQQDARSERDRVLAYVNDCNEGVSCISASIGTGIRRSAVESILKSLVEEHAINSAWSTKGGYCMYYPMPEPKKAIARPEQKDRLAGYERKIDAGEIQTPDPELDRASPDRFPPEERPSKKCLYCGEVKEKYLWQHEQFCKKNPDHKNPSIVTTKTPRAEPETVPCPIGGCKSMLRKNRKAIYGHLYGTTHHLPLAEVHAHLDKILGADRQRTHLSRSSTPAEEKVAGIPPSTPGSERQLTEEPVPDPQQPEDPAPIEHTVPPLSAIESIIPDDVMSNSVQPCEVNSTSSQGIEFTSSPSKDVQVTYNGMNYGRPIDPLSVFAQQHRVRVGREIRKLKKVERKLRRRAAAAVAMADRVMAARRTKERELRRFEKELGEVSS